MSSPPHRPINQCVCVCVCISVRVDAFIPHHRDGEARVVVTVRIRRHHHGSTGRTFGSLAPTLARTTTVAGKTLFLHRKYTTTPVPPIPTSNPLPVYGSTVRHGKRATKPVSQSQSSRKGIPSCRRIYERSWQGAVGRKAKPATTQHNHKKKR